MSDDLQDKGGPVRDDRLAIVLLGALIGVFVGGFTFTTWWLLAFMIFGEGVPTWANYIQRYSFLFGFLLSVFAAAFIVAMRRKS